MNRECCYSGRIIFDHLPKTAGQAINSWLQRELGAGSITPNLIGTHQELIRRYGGIYAIISGHISFYPAEKLDPRYRYITLLRDPIDRCISWIFYLVNDVIPTPETLPIIEGAKKFLDSDGLNSTQEFLSGISNLYVEHFSRIDCAFLPNDDERLLSAITAISSYDVVGVYEHMSDFLSDTACLIEISAPDILPKTNVTSSRLAVNQISPILRQRIAELNMLDIQLYERVVELKQSLWGRKREFTAISRWKKYEPIINRVSTTPDIPKIIVTLREGDEITHGQVMTFELNFLLTLTVPELIAGIHIFDANRNWAFGTNSSMLKKNYMDIAAGSNQVIFYIVADLPAGKYTAGFSISQKLQEGLKELAWYDVLCEFNVFNQVNQEFAGNNYLPAEISMEPTLIAGDEILVNNPEGKIDVLGSIKSFSAGNITTVNVSVSNNGGELWKGDLLRPVNLTYHWIDNSGLRVVFGGLRTELPKNGIAPGQNIEIEMMIQAPQEPGQYQLVLTIVQEMFLWFEYKEFEPTKLEIVVE